MLVQVLGGGRRNVRVWPRLTWLIGRGQFLFVLIVGAITIESLLMARFFVQITGRYSPKILSLTDPLVSPFAGYEPSATEKTTGVFEFSTILAAEAYLALAAGVFAAVVFTPYAISMVKGGIWATRKTIGIARATDAHLAYVVEKYQVRERVRAIIYCTALIVWAISVLLWDVGCAITRWSWRVACGIAVAVDAACMRAQEALVAAAVRTAGWAERTIRDTALMVDVWLMRTQVTLSHAAVWTGRALIATFRAVDTWCMRAQHAIVLFAAGTARASWSLVCGAGRAVDRCCLAAQSFLAGTAVGASRMAWGTGRKAVGVPGACWQATVACFRFVDSTLMRAQRGIGSALRLLVVRPIRAVVSESLYATAKGFSIVRSGAATCVRWTGRVVRNERIL